MKRQTERFVDYQDPNRNNSQPPSWSDDHFRPQPDQNYMNSEPPNSGGGEHWSSGYDSGRKRGYQHSGRRASPDHVDGGTLAKLYVAPIPRTSTEHEVHALFSVHGNVVEVAFGQDKRNGQRGGYCFVKYTTYKEADMAIAALNEQYTFPGGSDPIKVKYADGGRGHLGHANSNGGWERPGISSDKLFVGCMNKHATEQEIVDIFSAYGHVEDFYLVRDEHKQSRGYGFLKFSQREMAVAAINALDGNFVMRGCDHLLAVRFADPKKQRTGESRPFSNFGDSGGRQVLPTQQNQPIASNLPQVAPPHWTNPEAWPHGVNQQSHPLHPSTQSLEHPQNLSSTREEPTWSGSNCTIPTVHTGLPSPRKMDSLESDWSEHTCPDGFKYYYNCETCESLWEKPLEFAIYEQNLQSQSNLQNTSSQHSLVNTDQAVQIQEELHHMQIQSETSRL